MIQTMTIKEAMASSSLPRLEVRMLLEAVLNKPRTWLIAHDDEMLTEQQAQVFYIMVARRTAGVPMAYLLGTREFMGLTFCVSPHVLIPRPDTETLVNKAIEVLRVMAAPSADAPDLLVQQVPDNGLNCAAVELLASQPLKVLDLGTGSGAIAIAIAKACPGVQVDATDFSGEALGVAQLNAQCLDAQVNWFQGDWYQALPIHPSNVLTPVGAAKPPNSNQAIESLKPRLDKVYDLIVSNPPYIRCDDEHLAQGDLRFEPPHALTDGADGLSALKIIIQQAPNWLKLKGQLWVEHGYDQADEVLQMFTQAGFKGVKTLYDLGEKPRATGGYLAVNL
jgi:release factor glutamine methyltransferase